MSLLLHVAFVLICAINDCQALLQRCNVSSVYKCKWTVDNYTLDLTVFQRMGMNLTGQDSVYNYAFSPCNNLQFREDFVYYTAMAIQWNNSYRNTLAVFNNNIKPTISFNEDSEIIWTFQYDTNFYVQYICVSTNETLMEITDILEILPNRYMIQISSYYVCNAVTIPIDLFIDECIWTVHNYTLDLTPLYGQTISTSGSDNRYYSVCQDRWISPNFNKMCGMYGDNQGGMYAAWNSAVQPLFNLSTYTWTFLYDESGYNVEIQWICNPKIQTWKVKSTGLNHVKYMIIESQYACDEQECLFYDPENHGNKLDLTGIQGEIIEYTDADLTYSYQYTPCSNKINCDDLEVMAIRWDIKQRECSPYLAIWDNFNGYNLSYDSEQDQWKFTYDNGQKCSKILQTNVEFNIYFNCAENGIDWNVTSEKSIDECNYEMYIVSKYAC